MKEKIETLLKQAHITYEFVALPKDLVQLNRVIVGDFAFVKEVLTKETE